MAGEKFKGVPFFMNGQNYLIPSLSLKQFEDNYDALTAPIGDVTSENLKDQFHKYLPIIGMALRRNYPEVLDADLWDWLDLASFREVLLAVQAASGLKAATPGE